ncbi:hypothetical protein RchiOBHm_Chr2g0173321 [Rosa chinensis]|uniref:Uncharacterized protein n=1 Tax=Rosa chinensis TaxID=74649 RepID=A0A2P6S5V4_ROSCH|nr:hypothetical protein RchiOBHm_Chr2g0173321 [Rosa chinensis]
METRLCNMNDIQFVYQQIYPTLLAAHEKIGVVDAQWIVHQGVPSLGNHVNPSFGT